MATYFSLVTAVGQAKLAAAIAAGTSLPLTYMAVGDGNGSAVNPSESMTALVNEKFRAQITNLYVDESNHNYMVAELTIPAATGGFTIRECGVFDSSGVLFAIANFPETYKPVVSDGSTRELVVRVIIILSDTSTVSLSIDATVVMASRKWVSDNFSMAKLIPGGTAGQVLRKIDATSGNMEWGTPASASETAQGIVELATVAEATAGTDTERAVTPKGVKASILSNSPAPSAATETVAGILKLATQAQVDAGVGGGSVTPETLAGLIATLRMVPPGTVAYAAMSSAPTGWLPCNGALVSRTAYAALFAAIGTTYGVGDGNTTFGLPDLRGEVIRGWDSGRGVDAARVFGSAQADAMQGHWHATMVGATNGVAQSFYGSGNTEIYATDARIRGPITDGTNGTPRVAAETRMRNVALLACIRY